MSDDSDNLTPPSGDGKPFNRGHFRVLPGGDAAPARDSVDIDPTAWSSQDVGSMLRIDQPTPDISDELDTETEQPFEPAAEPDAVTDAAAPVADTPTSATPTGEQAPRSSYEVAYADGSTTPPQPPKRSVLSTLRHGRPEAAIASAEGADIWAAHRGPDAAPSLAGSPQAAPAVQGRRRQRATLLVLALATGLAVIAAAVVALGGGQPSSSPHKHATARVTQTVTQPALTQTVATVTTPAKTVVKKHHRRKHQRKPVVHHKTSTTTTAVTSTTTAAYTPPARTTTALTHEQTTSTPTKTTATKTTATKSTTSQTSTSSTSGAVNCAKVMQGYQSGALPTPAQAACAP